MGEGIDLKVAAWVLAGALVAFAAVRGVSGCGDATPEAVRVAPRAAARAPAPSASRGGAAPGLIYVHVAGEVRRPGLLRIPAGARTAVALERAGGPTRRADLTAINLAERLADGRQIVVPRIGASAPAATSPGSAGAAQTGAAPAGAAKPSLSTATAEQLDGLDGIGPTLAERIVAERERRGGFRSIGELAEVEGIGEKRLAALKGALAP